jgi:hypothetical protein
LLDEDEGGDGTSPATIGSAINDRCDDYCLSPPWFHPRLVQPTIQHIPIPLHPLERAAVRE